MELDWGAVNRPKQGQSVSGDAYVVQPVGEQSLLVAVIDGLGGGVEAARAAEGAIAVLKAYPSSPLNDLINRTHQALYGTRGAVMALLRLDLPDRRASFVGVGNIGVQVYSSASIKPISKNGILGYRLPSLLHLHYTYNSGDTFVLYSDGITSRFGLEEKLDRGIAPQAFADLILQRYGKPNDDATVVVVRCP